MEGTGRCRLGEGRTTAEWQRKSCVKRRAARTRLLHDGTEFKFHARALLTLPLSPPSFFFEVQAIFEVFPFFREREGRRLYMYSTAVLLSSSIFLMFWFGCSLFLRGFCVDQSNIQLFSLTSHTLTSSLSTCIVLPAYLLLACVSCVFRTCLGVVP